ncbi:MAG: lysozyme [Janthinobacterium lividum]
MPMPSETPASAECLALVKRFEGCRLEAYLPTPTDCPTIGWGATRDELGAPVRLGQRWSQARADMRIAADLQGVADRLRTLLGAAPTTASQFDALAAIAYNVGIGAIARSTLLALHLKGSFAAAAAQFARWNRQGAVVLPGLTRRRAAEAALYRRA